MVYSDSQQGAWRPPGPPHLIGRQPSISLLLQICISLCVGGLKCAGHLAWYFFLEARLLWQKVTRRVPNVPWGRGAGSPSVYQFFSRASPQDIFIADISHYHLYQSWCIFCKLMPFFCMKNTKVCPILAHFGYFVINLRTWCPF